MSREDRGDRSKVGDEAEWCDCLCEGNRVASEFRRILRWGLHAWCGTRNGQILLASRSNPRWTHKFGIDSEEVGLSSGICVNKNMIKSGKVISTGEHTPEKFFHEC